MSSATLILGAIALALAAYAYRQGPTRLKLGLTHAWKTARRTLPLLLLAFVVVGHVNTLAPQDLVLAWIGPEAGIKGLLVGQLTGMLLPGGPYVVFPLIASLYQAGAGMGPTLTIITSWATLGLLSVTYELPFLGWRFTLLRVLVTFPVPLLVGLAGWLLMAN